MLIFVPHILGICCIFVYRLIYSKFHHQYRNCYNFYYIQNQSKVAEKKIDLAHYPPPDLVVEFDINHTFFYNFKLSLFRLHEGII